LTHDVLAMTVTMMMLLMMMMMMMMMVEGQGFVLLVVNIFVI